MFSNEKHANLAAVHCWAKALLYSDSASFRGNYVVEILASADKFLIKRPGIVNDPGLTSQPSVSKSM